MRSLSLPALVTVMLVCAVMPPARAEDGCVDGRTVRIDCRLVGKVLTSYGCEAEFGVRCLAPAEIPLGEIFVSGGFRRVPAWQATRLFRDGAVRTFFQERGSPVRTETVLRVEAAQLTRVLDAFSKTQPGGTLTTDETRPVCMDAPSTSYFVYVIDGPTAAKIEVGAERGCRPYYSNGEGAYNARGVLANLEAFVRTLQ